MTQMKKASHQQPALLRDKNITCRKFVVFYEHDFRFKDILTSTNQYISESNALAINI